MRTRDLTVDALRGLAARLVVVGHVSGGIAYAIFVSNLLVAQVFPFMALGFLVSSNDATQDALRRRRINAVQLLSPSMLYSTPQAA